MRKALTTLGIVAALTTSFTLSARGGGVTTDPALSSAIQLAQIVVEPVLNFDVTGSTLLGPIHLRLTVYNNGLITASQCGLNGSNSAGTTVTSPAQVAQLRKDLIEAGGMTLPDQSLIVADLPLTTVTVFRGSTNSRSHTFSYWASFAEYAPIAQIINDFSAANPTECFGSILE